MNSESSGRIQRDKAKVGLAEQVGGPGLPSHARSAAACDLDEQMYQACVNSPFRQHEHALHLEGEWRPHGYRGRRGDFQREVATSGRGTVSPAWRASSERG